MEKIFSAKSLDDAKAQAFCYFAEFGVAQYDIDFNILEQPVKRLFGTKGDYRVIARAEIPVKKANTEQLKKPAQAAQPAQPAQTAWQPVQNAATQASLPAKDGANPVAANNPANVGSSQRSGYSGRGHYSRSGRTSKPGQSQRQNPAAAEKKPEAPVSVAKEPVKENFKDNVKPQPPVSTEKFDPAVSYLTNVLSALGMRGFAVKVVQGGSSPVLDIVGDKLGTAIGRRGETLDALQYLTILALGRGEAHSDRYRRLTVDCNGYRAKRRESLESLAERTAKKVIAGGRRIALEPMNPYERRIIHSKVSEIAGVNSSSVGEDPYRKVVISFGSTAAADKTGADAGDSKAKSGADRYGKYERTGGRDHDREHGHARRRDRDNRDNRRDRDRDRVNNPQGEVGAQFGRDVFATSFERDYKRNNSRRDTGSKDSDRIQISAETTELEKNALLYGKIEL
jgi:spoIIIJ-associated protein